MGLTLASDVPAVGEFSGLVFDPLAAGGVRTAAELPSPLPDYVEERLLVLINGRIVKNKKTKPGDLDKEDGLMEIFLNRHIYLLKIFFLNI